MTPTQLAETLEGLAGDSANLASQLRLLFRDPAAVLNVADDLSDRATTLRALAAQLRAEADPPPATPPTCSTRGCRRGAVYRCQSSREEYFCGSCPCWGEGDCCVPMERGP